MRATLLASIAMLGCSGGCGAPAAEPLRVFAASSLTDSFADLEALFEQEHPGVDVVVTTAGSQVLRLQIEQGASADVFASADVEHVDALARIGLVESSIVFAGNELVIAVPEGEAGVIRGWRDLPSAERVVLGATEVPAGRYADRFLDRADAVQRGFRERVLRRVVSREPNVRLALAKVELGEADAALVYRTDVTEARRARAIPIDDAVVVQTECHLATLVNARSSTNARRWVELVTSDAGSRILTRHGFTVEE